ncbi:MAG: molybdopterin molybdotransferase MoeA [Gemmataceae bacterium]
MTVDLDTAWRAIANALPPSRIELGPVLSNQLGMVLAEDIVADMDMPPFTRSMMDGFAVCVSEENPEEAFRITGRAEAGSIPGGKLMPGEAWHIATGAPVPENTSWVLPKEMATLEPGESATERVVAHSLLKTGKNLFESGGEFRSGSILLRDGTSLGPAEYGLLAQAGRTAVKMHAAPRVAIVSTGNELVDPNMKPGPGKIRNSNGPMLMAQVARTGAVPRFLGIAPDCPQATESLVKEGLGHQVLLLSGGVSVGPKDLVRPALEKLGVQIKVHGVQLKPGKPFLFGIHPSGVVVFGLPGNPVSSYVTFELLVRPALQRLKGMANAEPVQPIPARLTHDWRVQSDRPLRQPAKLILTNEGPCVEVPEWKGSPDLRSLIGTNALACLQPGTHSLVKADNIQVVPLG